MENGKNNVDLSRLFEESGMEWLSLSISMSPPSIPPHPLAARQNLVQASDQTDTSEIIPPPFPWAIDRPATIHKLEYLVANHLAEIKGDLQCRRCERSARISFDVLTKFHEVRSCVLSMYGVMHDRALDKWMNPAFTDCSSCGQSNCMKPMVAEQRENINWLFMFLGQTLGCCTLDQLKYFCRHNKIHRTGAKNRVLFSCYITICKQLDPALSHILIHT